MSFVRFSIGLVLVVAIGTPTWAQVEENPLGAWYLAEAQRGWYVDAFAGIESEPTYAGSDASEVEPDVGLRAVFRDGGGRRYLLSIGELGFAQPLGKTGMLTTIFEFEEGRDDEDDPTLTGFAEVEETVELQAAAAWRIGRGYLGVVAQPDLLDRGKGFVWFLGGGYDRTVVPERFRYSLSADLSWGDAEHMRTEFGVTAAEALVTGLPEYRPAGSLKSATAGVDLEWRFADRWSLLAGVEIEHYFDEAAESPLIELEGSRRTLEASVGVRFRFGRPERWRR